MLSRFKWYRRWRGGIWWKVARWLTGRGLTVFEGWQRSPPHKSDWATTSVVLAVEDYTRLKPPIGAPLNVIDRMMWEMKRIRV